MKKIISYLIALSVVLSMCTGAVSAAGLTFGTPSNELYDKLDSSTLTTVSGGHTLMSNNGKVLGVDLGTSDYVFEWTFKYSASDKTPNNYVAVSIGHDIVRLYFKNGKSGGELQYYASPKRGWGRLNDQQTSPGKLVISSGDSKVDEESKGKLGFKDTSDLDGDGNSTETLYPIETTKVYTQKADFTTDFSNEHTLRISRTSGKLTIAVKEKSATEYTVYMQDIQSESVGDGETTEVFAWVSSKAIKASASGLWIGGEYARTYSLNSDNTKATVNITYNGSAATAPTVVVVTAAYIKDANGVLKLTSVDSESKALSKGEAVVFENDVVIPASVSGETPIVKSFIWNSFEDMIPLRHAMTHTIN